MKPFEVESEHTGVDFARYFRRKRKSNPGTQPSKCAAYAQTTIRSDKDHKVTVHLGFDDWMKIWLNGKSVKTLRHDNGFESAEVELMLKKGDNRLIIQLSNFDNVEWRCWAFSCVINKAE